MQNKIIYASAVVALLIAFTTEAVLVSHKNKLAQLETQAVFSAAGPTGALSAAAFHVGASATDTNQRIIYNSATGALFYDSDGNAGGGGAQVQIAVLTPGLALTNSQFAIV